MQIKFLLIEAARLGQTAKTEQDEGKRMELGRRLCKIQSELCDGLYKHSDQEANIVAQGVIDHLFVDTIDHRPELLPQLFPTFAMLCGERDPKLWITDIDWEVNQVRSA